MPTCTNRKRFLAIDGSARSLWRTRGALLKAAVQAGHEVIACAAMDTSMVDIQVSNLTDKYKAMGVQFHELHMQRQGKNPLREVYTLWELWRLMLRLRPDVVLSYSIKSVLYGSLAARLAEVTHYYSAITGLGYLFVSNSGRKNLFRKAIHRLLRVALMGNRQVFFQNPDDRDLFLHLGLLRDRNQAVIVNGSGVDLERFSEVPLPNGPITFLMIARVQYHKGVVEYVQAARILKRSYPDIRFQLLGPFDDHPSAISKSEFQELIQDGVVEFLGGTPDVRPFIAQCHVYVLPSYREGMPLSALEAMAMGRPVVTTDVPGCREIVVNGDNGFLVMAKDSVGLAEAMRRFLENPVLVSQMGKRSRQIVEVKYDVKKVVDTMMVTMALS